MDPSGKPSDDQQIDPPHREQPPSGGAPSSGGTPPTPAPAQATAPESVPRSRVKRTIMDLARYRLG